jgi:hypothetical protein
MSFRTDDVVLLTNSSMGADFEAPPINVAAYIGISVQAIYTGSPTGTLVIQASGAVTNRPGDIDSSSWVDIGNDPVTAAGSSLFNIRTPFYKWVRIVYRRTSGTGTVTSITANLRFT